LYDNIVVVFLTFLPEFENQTTFCTDNHWLYLQCCHWDDVWLAIEICLLALFVRVLLYWREWF
jgi:hypothetical protein